MTRVRVQTFEENGVTGEVWNRDTASAAGGSWGPAGGNNGLVSGLVMSINGSDPAKFDVSAGVAYIGNVRVEVAAKTAQTVTNIAGANLTHVFQNADGTLTQQTTSPTPMARRASLYLGQIGHQNRTSIGSIVNSPDVFNDPAAQFRDLMRCLGVFSCIGNVVSANGANLSINVSAGGLFGSGINQDTDPTSPNEKIFGALTAPSVRMRTQTGNGSTSTSLDVTNYDLNGTVTVMQNNKFQVMRIYRLSSNNIVVQYGQAEYGSIADAVDGIAIEPFVELANVRTIGALIGLLVVKKGTTSLNVTTDAKFVSIVGKFG